MGTQVAVVMPVYNAERFLRESMDSVLGQTFSDFVFLVCDDGSGDGSLSILEEYACRDKRVRILSNERNLGTAGTRNRLLAALPADCVYVAIMDADDVCMPDRLERQLEFLKSHDEHICGVGSSLTKSSICFLNTPASTLMFANCDSASRAPSPVSGSMSSPTVRCSRSA